MNHNDHDLDRIASDIAALGAAANESAIAMVVHRAATMSVDPLLLSVLSDPAQPGIARARAFGMVAARLAKSGGPPEDPRDATASPPVLAAI